MKIVMAKAGANHHRVSRREAGIGTQSAPATFDSEFEKKFRIPVKIIAIFPLIHLSHRR